MCTITPFTFYSYGYSIITFKSQTKTFQHMKITILAALVLIGSIAATTSEENDLARVQRISGKYVFIMCEPLQEYEVVETVNTSVSTMLAGQQSISDQVKEMVNKALRRERKGKFEFDALVTEDGDSAILIKFKD
jgi:hypothetical protein